MMVKTFTDLVLTAITDTIPNKRIICNRNDPPWMTPEIKRAIRRKHRVYKKYVSRGRKIDELAYMRVVRNKTTHLIDRAKGHYFEKLGKKLSDPSTGTKSYWTTLKNILNKKKNSVIPPLLENGVFITNFQAKADIFNELFVEECSIIPNNSVLPSLIFRTNKLSNIAIDETEILKLIRKLNTNKAHGRDELSVKMIKLCDNTIVLPLRLVYEKCLATGTYPQIWKMANVLPIHKKESRQIKKNYRPISLLPICGKIFEKILFDKIYDHLFDNELLSPNQSGFRPGDSTVNQLIAITHQIHVAFEEYLSTETRAVFLDISKAFDKVWHDGLLHKFESNEISGLLLNLIRDLLSERQQRVVLNGKIPTGATLVQVSPQGSVLGPLFFLVYINDLVDNISSDAKLFADDTSFLLSCIMRKPLQQS